MSAASTRTWGFESRTAIRRCKTNGCSMPSYTVQESGYCRTCEKKNKFTAERRRSQRPISSTKDSLKETGFTNTLSKSYQQITKRDGLRGSVSMPRETQSSSFSESRTKRRISSIQQRSISPLMGSPLISKVASSEHPRAKTPPSRSELPSTTTPHRPLLKSPLQKRNSGLRKSNSFNKLPEKRTSLTTPPGGGLRRGISFDKQADKQRCRTTGCDSAIYLLQENGFCTSCNTKAKVVAKLEKLGANNTALPAPAETKSTPAAKTMEEGSAFGGRLSYNFVRKGSQSDMPLSAAPSDKVVDYQYLRLKFLLNKAIAKGVDMMEVFEHFDTDFSGEVDFNEFNDGLKRLGIFLTHAESKALLGRFQATGTGSIPYKDFFTSLNLDLPASSSAMFDSPKSKGILKNPSITSRNLSFRDLPEEQGNTEEEKNKSSIIEVPITDPSPSKLRASPIKSHSPTKARQSPGRKRGGGGASPPRSSGPSPAKHRAPKAGSKIKELSEAELLGVLQRVQKEMLRLAKSKHGLPKFRKVFSSIDKDGSGVISADEFTKTLHEIGCELEEGHILQGLNVFDKDQNGSVDYNEFLKFCEADDVGEAIRASKSKKKKKGTRI